MHLLNCHLLLILGHNELGSIQNLSKVDLLCKLKSVEMRKGFQGPDPRRPIMGSRQEQSDVFFEALN